MILERRMVTAIGKENGVPVIGYYHYIGWTEIQKHLVIPNFASAYYAIEIDPDTIEDVAVEVTKIDGFYCCPDCTTMINSEVKYMASYCIKCGLKLDWSDTHAKRT